MIRQFINTKVIALAILSLIQTVAFAQTVSTPVVVDRFYGTMVKLCNTTNESSAFDYRNILTECFRGRENSGIWTPNDFKDWGYRDDTKLTANLYVKRFYELSFLKKLLKIEQYNIVQTYYLSEADLEQFKNQSNNKYIQTIATKTFANGNMRKTFTDTLLVEKNEIVVFKNAVRTDDADISIDALTAIAASHYSAKQYHDAYRTYEKIIRMDSRNSNAYYRLGIMTYYGKGCTRSKNKAIEYMTIADRLGAKNADRVLIKMKYRNR